MPGWSSRIVLPLLGTLVVSCASGDTVIEHPTAENIVAPTTIQSRISRTNTAPTPALAALAGAFRSATLVWQTGQLPDTLPEPGRVQDAALAPDGRLFVLDSTYTAIHVFDRGGVFMHTISSGPRDGGLFRYPHSLAVTVLGTLVLVDKIKQVLILSPSSSSEPRRSSFRLQFVPDDVCVIDDGIFVRGWSARDATILHKYNPSGDMLGSFIPGYVADTRFIQDQLSKGLLACSGETSSIVLVSTYLPYVTAVSPSGEMRWRAAIDEFSPMHITEVRPAAAGRPSVLYDRNVTHDLPVTLLSAGRALVLQIQHTTHAGAEPNVRLDTYLIDAASGVGWYVSSTLPRMYAITDRHFIAAADSSSRAVLLYAFGTRS